MTARHYAMGLSALASQLNIDSDRYEYESRTACGGRVPSRLVTRKLDRTTCASCRSYAESLKRGLS